MRRVRHWIVACLTAALLGSSLLWSASAASALVGPLHTSGNQILDANDQPVTLRGAAIELLNWYPWALVDPNTPALNPPSLDGMKSWGINAVRVFLGSHWWLITPGCGNTISAAQYKQQVDTVVSGITSRGMLAILDLHWNTKNAAQPCNTAGQQKMADAPRSQLFWQEVANRYKANPLVAFDLYNEPHDLGGGAAGWSKWRNGGTLQDGLLVWQAAGMQQMYDAVRGTGAQNLVFVSGNDWANNSPASEYLLTGTNIVYAAHYYTCPGQAPPTCTAPDPYNPAPPGQRLDLWTPLSETHPVVVTEFGWPDPASGAYNQNVIDWAESRDVGWTAYSWCVANADPASFFCFLNSWANYDPSASGVPVKNGVALNP